MRSPDLFQRCISIRKYTGGQELGKRNAEQPLFPYYVDDPMDILTVQPQTFASKRFFEELGDGVRLEMVRISGGTFKMGSPDDEPDREDWEGPQHDVKVPSFFMGRYPVTQAQWKAVCRLEKVDRALESEPSSFKGKEDSDRRPVEWVNWYDAREFCARLSKHTQRTYQLPTEAQWEYACRGGTTTPFYCGETITTAIANYHGNYTYGRGSKGDYRGETTPVDHFKMANPFGLCDMHGNVFEWCLDHWHENYKGAPTGGSAWTTGGDDSRRIIRGGSWSLDPRDCRSASRNLNTPDITDYDIGFRVVLAPRGLPSP